MRLAKTLIAITPRERVEFFPDEMFEQLAQLVPDLLVVDPSSLSGESAWRECLAAEKPEIIVSCWKTPALPGPQPACDIKYLCHLAGSVRKFVTAEQIERGLLVSNWGNSVSRVIAECGLFLTIAALRQATHWTMAMHQEGGWKDDSTEFFSLFERRVGLHGFGSIAQQLARLMKPFDVRLQAFSPSVPDATLTECGVTRATSLEALFADNDVVIELAPLTARTEGMVTEAILRRLKPGSVFVNIGRGAVVDEAALARVASEGKIQVALDVFGIEPLPLDSPFRGMRNVTMLPHLSGPTTDRRRDAGRLAINNIRRYLKGEALEAHITNAVFARST